MSRDRTVTAFLRVSQPGKPDHDHYFEAVEGSVREQARQEADRLVYKLPFRSTYGEPTTQVSFACYKQHIKEGKLELEPLGEILAAAPMGELEPERYEELIKQKLAHLPEEFAAFVEHEAWQQGHSAGRLESLSIAVDLGSRLGKALANYQLRMLEATKGSSDAGKQSNVRSAKRGKQAKATTV